MESTSAPALITGAADAAGQQGAGDLLRIVLVVAILGVALTAWFLLRGYRRDGGGEDH